MCRMVLADPGPLSEGHLANTLGPMLAKITGTAEPALRAAGCTPALIQGPPQRCRAQLPGQITQASTRPHSLPSCYRLHSPRAERCTGL